MKTSTRLAGLLLVGALLAGSVGCTGVIDPAQASALLQQAVDGFNSVIDNLQQGVQVPENVTQQTSTAITQINQELGTNVNINIDVNILGSARFIDNFGQDVTYQEGIASVFVAFTNVTGNDIWVEYFIDNTEQSVYVYSGDSLVVEYDCNLFSPLLIATVAEVDFDPVTGSFLAAFPFTQLNIARGTFDCGDLVEFTFTPNEANANVTPVQLF